MSSGVLKFEWFRPVCHWQGYRYLRYDQRAGSIIDKELGRRGYRSTGGGQSSSRCPWSLEIEAPTDISVWRTVRPGSHTLICRSFAIISSMAKTWRREGVGACRGHLVTSHFLTPPLVSKGEPTSSLRVQARPGRFFWIS